MNNKKSYMTSNQGTSVPANENNGFVEKMTMNLIINRNTIRICHTYNTIKKAESVSLKCNRVVAWINLVWATKLHRIVF